MPTASDRSDLALRGTTLDNKLVFYSKEGDQMRRTERHTTGLILADGAKPGFRLDARLESSMSVCGSAKAGTIGRIPA
jgi:hypothetical protein